MIQAFLQKIRATLDALRESGSLSVAYALLAEALLLGYIAFIGLFTLETLLPTFVSARLSLTKFCFFLVLFSFLLGFLGSFLRISFPASFTKKNPLLVVGILWMLGILTLSLLSFPPFIIVLILLAFLLIGLLFWKILFDETR